MVALIPLVVPALVSGSFLVLGLGKLLGLDRLELILEKLGQLTLRRHVQSIGLLRSEVAESPWTPEPLSQLGQWVKESSAEERADSRHNGRPRNQPCWRAIVAGGLVHSVSSWRAQLRRNLELHEIGRTMECPTPKGSQQKGSRKQLVQLESN